MQNHTTCCNSVGVGCSRAFRFNCPTDRPTVLLGLCRNQFAFSVRINRLPFQRGRNERENASERVPCTALHSVMNQEGRDQTRASDNIDLDRDFSVDFHTCGMGVCALRELLYRCRARIKYQKCDIHDIDECKSQHVQLYTNISLLPLIIITTL